ncbi:MAG: hypothetical protein R6U08_03770 [Bacillota bacterium]
MLVNDILKMGGIEILSGGFQPPAQNGQLWAVYPGCSSLEIQRHIEDALYHLLFCISGTEHIHFAAAGIYLDKYREYEHLLFVAVRNSGKILELSLFEEVDAAVITQYMGVFFLKQDGQGFLPGGKVGRLSHLLTWWLIMDRKC